MKNEEMAERLSAIEKSIADLRKDVDVLLSEKEQRDSVNKVMQSMTQSPDFAKLLKSALSL